MIPVTKTFLPEQSEFNSILEEVWKTSWITNRGALVSRLEVQLKSYLKLEGMFCMTNGTLPLQIAIKALDLKGEIITTPFSYVATTSTIVWENCQPVFVDIDPEYLTIDETKIEDAITENTSAILATHIFGNPCHTEFIEKLANRYNLKVVYDAAHCFGVNYKNKSLFGYGDISTCSFHATKIFHTGEGGAIFSSNKLLLEKLYNYHNCGHKGTEDFYGIGINAKMSELQAAMGLAVLPYFETILKKRSWVVEYYNQNIDWSLFQKMKIRRETEWNFGYYPLIFKSEECLLTALTNLNKLQIFPRRYFYPSLNQLSYVKKQACPVSESVSSRIICLPLYTGLQELELKLIVDTLNNSF